MAALAIAGAALAAGGAFSAPTLRATVETALTTSGFVSAFLLGSRARRGRRLSDLLVALAVLVLAAYEFEFQVLPSVFVIGRPVPATAALAGRMLVALAFLAAAISLRTERLTAARQARFATGVALVVIAGLGLAGPARLAFATTGHPLGYSAVTSASSVLLTSAAAGLMVTSAVVWCALGDRIPPSDAVFADANVLFASAWLYEVVVARVPAGWVSGREVLRAAAYGCILFAALRSRAAQQRAERERAVREERRRLADDLHDGLAQDLAFIVMHGREFERRLGGEHPIVIAAQRALEASRGAIIDLSAAQAPTARGALETVARELSARHGVEVNVESDGAELDRPERDELVRIAREAVMNAIQHGAAHMVRVALSRHKGSVVLTVSDDGVGIAADDNTNGYAGHGVAAMRARATRLGGTLTITRRAHGGTDVELLVSRRGPVSGA